MKPNGSTKDNIVYSMSFTNLFSEAFVQLKTDERF